MAPAMNLISNRPTTLDTASTPGVRRKAARFTFDLRGLEGRLQALADERGTSMARIVREAVMTQMHDLPVATRDRAIPREREVAGARTKVRVRFTQAQALMLTTRARAAALSKGDYLASLMEGSSPPADPALLIRNLMSVADRLATFSADLSRIARLSGGANSSELQGLHLVLQAMHQEIRGDMVVVSETLQRLTHAGKPQ